MAKLSFLSIIWDAYNAADDAGELGGLAVSYAGLRVAESRIEQNIRSYVGDKSAANSKAVVLNTRQIRDFLKTIEVDQPSIKDLVDSATPAKYQVSILLANYASQLMANIAMAVGAGNLPPLDDTPWSTRRAGYVRLMQGARAMGLQFEAIVRKKQRELTNITELEGRLFGLAFAPELTDADLRMIQADMDEQKKEEDATRRSLAVFVLLANRSRQNHERFSKIIDAGDRAQTRSR